MREHLLGFHVLTSIAGVVIKPNSEAFCDSTQEEEN